MTTPQLVADRYELEDLPILGAMGEVFTAYDPLLDCRAAIKRMHADLTTDPELVKRFEREARLIARVNHPGIPASSTTGPTSTARTSSWNSSKARPSATGSGHITQI